MPILLHSFLAVHLFPRLTAVPPSPAPRETARSATHCYFTTHTPRKDGILMKTSKWMNGLCALAIGAAVLGTAMPAMAAEADGSGLNATGGHKYDVRRGAYEQEGGSQVKVKPGKYKQEEPTIEAEKTEPAPESAKEAPAK